VIFYSLTFSFPLFNPNLVPRFINSMTYLFRLRLSSVVALGTKCCFRPRDMSASSCRVAQAEWSEPFGLRHVDELMSSRSGSRTIAKIILLRIRYSICESKHLVMESGYLFFFSPHLAHVFHQGPCPNSWHNQAL